ncbi:Mdm33 family-domain-containing protein [Rhodofomes roseus]|uniref:Sensitive to high expression protein 9, mitochondrial n=1 Tax=Rhodofomes roseus TaxID=34475 RepID=A0ABQ8KS02_9APHY|nr:Mdm33 family-domain-containing protein [Rhodofomes roseus]KAH9841502.1 Mdm33 family-domain-containing protein [Rhodofomes roseus]
MLRTSLFRPSFHCASCLSAPRLVPIHHAFRARAQLRLKITNAAPPPKPSDETQPGPSQPREQEKIASSNVDAIAEVRERVQQWTTHTATAARRRIDQFTADVARSFSQLGKEINKATGYGEIEELKRRVVTQEGRIEAVRREAREAKEAYDSAVRLRASSQREVNDLLQRKSTWSDQDVIRFTELVRKDHLHEQEETRAKLAASVAEDAVEREFSELMRVILNRYHEEQAWSDKIRSASTYGSLAVMGVNMLVFVLAIVLVEPWKRKRLAQTFERKVEEMSAENAAMLEGKADALVQRMEAQDRVLSQIMETVYYSTQPSVASTVVAAADDGGRAAERTRTLHILTSDRAVAFAIASSATVAAIVGWLARSWYS